MAWPPAASSAFFAQMGASSTYVLKWGTDQLNPWASNYIVVSCSPSDKAEIIYIENGTGLEAIRVILWQGRRVNITVIDDTHIVPPSPGSTVSLVDILGDATSPAALNFRVVENSYNAARKEPGQRVLVLEYITLIEGNGTVP